MSYRLGIDVGGTFTDFLLLGDDDASSCTRRARRPTTRRVGFVHGLEEIAGAARRDFDGFMALDRADRARHDRVDERGAHAAAARATGALMTEGFRDTLRLRDGTRGDAVRQPPARRRAPLAPRERTYGIAERIGPRGPGARRARRGDVRAAAGRLRADGVEAVAISFLHSPQNAAHERRAREIVTEQLPDAYVTASNELLPQIR